MDCAGEKPGREVIELALLSQPGLTIACCALTFTHPVARTVIPLVALLSDIASDPFHYLFPRVVAAGAAAERNRILAPTDHQQKLNFDKVTRLYGEKQQKSVFVPRYGETPSIYRLDFQARQRFSSRASRLGISRHLFFKILSRYFFNFNLTVSMNIFLGESTEILEKLREIIKDAKGFTEVAPH